MKKATPLSILLLLVLVVLLCNVMPVKAFFIIFFGDIKPIGMYFVTQDKKYIYQGDLSDTLNNACYRHYRSLYPDHSHVLHRIRPKEVWKFWMWGEYLIYSSWHQPYLRIGDGELEQILQHWRTTYPSHSTLGCDGF